MGETDQQQAGATVVLLEAAQAALRDHFLGWQCRLRQLSVRQAGGRPTAGMRPRVRLAEGSEVLAEIIVLILRKNPHDSTAQFRHMVRKTQDPIERYDSALNTLAAAYYQKPQEFSDQLTALFGPDSSLVDRLLGSGRCILEFEQYNQCYSLPCSLRDMPESDPAYQGTYWHNALFNPSLPAGVRILGFQPDWAHATADPPVT